MGLPYATPVDMWSCGCIFAELFLRKPLFPGQYEMDQLQKVFDLIGTPSEEDWPERAAVSRSNFKNSATREWRDIVPEMDVNAQDLVKVRNDWGLMNFEQLSHFPFLSSTENALFQPESENHCQRSVATSLLQWLWVRPLVTLPLHILTLIQIYAILRSVRPIFGFFPGLLKPRWIGWLPRRGLNEWIQQLQNMTTAVCPVSALDIKRELVQSSALSTGLCWSQR